MYSNDRIALSLATLLPFYPGGFKTTHLQRWSQGLTGMAGKKFSGKTENQNC